MSEEIKNTPSKRNISFDDAFIAIPSPSKKMRHEFNTTELDEDQYWENQDPDNQDLENLEFSENFYNMFCEKYPVQKSIS